MFDRLLVKPMALDLCTALAEVGGEGRSFWEQQVGSLRGLREGRRWWEEQDAGLAWWTDQAGRRHFRVVGEPLFSPDDWPVIADLYPDVCLCRGVGQESPRWVLLCPCGTVVPADAGPWAGPRCGACPLEPDARSRPAFLNLGEVACAPLFEGGNYVLAELPDNGGRVMIRGPDGDPIRSLDDIRIEGPFAASPDGKHLVSSEPRARLRVHDLETGAMLADYPEPAADWIRFSPDGARLASLRDGRLTLYDFDRDTGAVSLRDTWQGGFGVAWSPDGRRFARAGHYGLEVSQDGRTMPCADPFPTSVEPPQFTDYRHDMEEFLALYSKWQEQRRPIGKAARFGPPRVQFTEGGDGLCLLRAADPAATNPQHVITRWRWFRKRWTQLGPPIYVPTVERSTLSPDGRWLAVDRGFVELFDAHTGETLGTVGWPCDEWYRPPVQFTADGRSLLIGHAGGLRVVPWALLLGVPESAGG